MAPRQSIPIREILYQLSPYQQDVLKQTFYNAPKTFLRFCKEKGPTILTAGGLFFGIKGYTEHEMHQERLAERY
ncbi:hypothetical protein PLESTB_001128100 [Pleodorina starrii]|uniref:Uncharacterized protein n=1 Tax=Pleodorina starrii TaxID=330485 RepID=A0A9W6F5M3_9CHLO|nr:hypothetical protein PLESTM_001365700 [Pleodorina starrii]GLC56625.1 hypothetical protein PLESTB_001128100 [Pleodorina starrii]GLC76213.1 hypothetical protein PLESTF_001750300 [Pleodorina starrii]GLC77488.1 hypothetical protein PLESTF_001941300 [Pleodorina starrii]